jgi:hypothetical protein
MEMDLSEEIAETNRIKEERFQLQLRALKRQKEIKWQKNNHNLFPTKEALRPSDREKNDIDFD